MCALFRFTLHGWDLPCAARVGRGRTTHVPLTARYSDCTCMAVDVSTVTVESSNTRTRSKRFSRESPRASLASRYSIIHKLSFRGRLLLLCVLYLKRTSMEPSIERAPISLTQTERETLISILRSAKHCEDSDCPLADEQLSLSQTVQDRLEGSKSVGATAGTNFGRDKHEAALGSTVMSVQLSIAEIDLLLRRLAGSEVSIKDSISGKLELLRDALLPTTAGSLADVAASVGLGSDPAPSVVPVTVLTGCLGAGKTTVIRGLLRGLPPGYKCAWLKNEYGDAGVDKTVAQDARVAVKEIVNGCLCCTKVGELADALRALHSLGPHRILVEASGSALPGPLVWEIEKETDIVRVDGVVTVVDGKAVTEGRFAHSVTAIDEQRATDENLDHETPLSELFADQVACADMILVNKTDLLDGDQADALVTDLRKNARDGVQVLKTSMGRLPVDVLLGQGIAAEGDLDARHEVHHRHDHDDNHKDESGHHDHHDHHHDDFESFVIELGEVNDAKSFSDNVSNIIRDNDILRLKGFAAISGKPMRLTLQAVGPRLDTYFDQPFGSAPRVTRLVVIGQVGLDRSAIEAALHAYVAPR